MFSNKYAQALANIAQGYIDLVQKNDVGGFMTSIVTAIQTLGLTSVVKTAHSVLGVAVANLPNES